MTTNDKPAAATTELPRSPAALEERIGYRFTDPALLLAALTHTSYLNEHPEQAAQDNQRLEFLGDSVLQLAVSQALYEAFPEEPEGGLTQLRAMLVSGSSLAEVARRIDLGDYLLLGRGEERSGGRDKESVLADAFEALAGALLLDGGFVEAQQVLLPLIELPLQGAAGPHALLDSKSRLQEITQSRHGCTPHYLLVGEQGPGHAKGFSVHVALAGRVWGTGQGSTKKAAEQAAAAQALARLEAAAEQPPDLQKPPPLEELEREARG